MLRPRDGRGASPVGRANSRNRTKSVRGGNDVRRSVIIGVARDKLSATRVQAGAIHRIAKYAPRAASWGQVYVERLIKNEGQAGFYTQDGTGISRTWPSPIPTPGPPPGPTSPPLPARYSAVSPALRGASPSPRSTSPLHHSLTAVRRALGSGMGPKSGPPQRGRGR